MRKNVVVKPTPIHVAGLRFDTIKDASRHFDVLPQSVARRLRQGWPIEEALGLVDRIRTPRGEQFSTNLKTSIGVFRTIELAAKHFGVAAGVIADRLRREWPPDEAVGIAPHKRKSKETVLTTCQGQVFPNLQVFADAFDKPYKLVHKRLRAGWTPEQAVDIEEPPPRFRNQVGGARDRHWKTVEIVEYKAYPGAAHGEFKVYVIRNQVSAKDYVGITVTPLQARLRGHRANAKKGVKGKLYNAMRHYGVDNFTIELVRSDALSFAELQEQEIDEIVRRDTVRSGYNTSPGGSIGTPTEITVAGVTYPSRGAAAAHFGIDVTVFNLRVSRLGWTPEQAAEIAPRRKFARHKVTIDGRTFPSLKSASERLGLNYKTVFKRVSDSGWTLEQALGLVPPPACGIRLLSD